MNDHNLIPGGKEHWILKAKKSHIADLFGVSIHTLNAWIQGKRRKKEGKFDIRSLKAICERYYDRRKKQEDNGK